MKQTSIPDVGYEEHQKFSKWHWGKVPKICRFQMFSCPICLKKQFAGHVSEYLCKWLGWVYRCEDFTFHFTIFFVQRQIPLTSRWYYTILMRFFFASTLLVEAVAYTCSVKRVFLEMSQNSKENTCASLFFNNVA